MGTTTNDQASKAAYTNMQMGDEVYGIARPAMEGGVNYLTGLYGQGGATGALDAKYNSRRADAMEAMQGGDVFSGTLGDASAARAIGYSGIGTERLTAGLDEVNKLRSALAQRGLQTTNLAQQAGAVSVGALGFMPQGNSTLSAILGAGALGASIYGGLAGQSTRTQGGRIYTAPIGPQPGTGTPNNSWLIGGPR